MKNALIALLLAVSCFAAPKKTTHVPTEAELCWKDVSASTEFPVQDNEALQTAFNRMNYCSGVLQADKLKSRIAFDLSVIYSQAIALNKQNEELKSAKEAQAVSEQSVKNVVKAYVELQGDYDAYQKRSNDLVDQMVSYMATLQSAQPVATPPAQQKRGFLASFAQGAGEAMRNQAAKPTIHCESSTFGNQTSTDCR